MVPDSDCPLSRTSVYGVSAQSDDSVAASNVIDVMATRRPRTVATHVRIGTDVHLEIRFNSAERPPIWTSNRSLDRPRSSQQEFAPHFSNFLLVLEL